MAGCEPRGLPLLPPRSPELDGMVERANRAVRIECWSQYRGELSCAAMNEALAAYLDRASANTVVRSSMTRPRSNSSGAMKRVEPNTRPTVFSYGPCR